MLQRIGIKASSWPEQFGLGNGWKRQRKIHKENVQEKILLDSRAIEQNSPGNKVNFSSKQYSSDQEWIICSKSRYSKAQVKDLIMLLEKIYDEPHSMRFLSLFSLYRMYMVLRKFLHFLQMINQGEKKIDYFSSQWREMGICQGCHVKHILTVG